MHSRSMFAFGRRPAWMPVVALWFGVILFATRPIAAQQTIAVAGDRLSGFILPIEPLNTDATLSSLRAWAWTVDDTKRLLLDGDVRIEVDGYNFTAEQAVIWINRLPSAAGEINQIAMFFPAVNDPTKRAGLGVEGKNVLITSSTRGEVRLHTARLENSTPNKDSLLKQAEARLAEHLKRLASENQTMAARPDVRAAPPPPETTFVPVPGGRVEPEDLELANRVQLPQTSQQWLRDPQGIVRWSADRIDITRGETENLVTVDGSIVIDFIAERVADNLSQITLGSERAVIFTEPGPLDELATSQMEAGAIRGIYLEGNVSVVAQGGEYIIRTPRAYYDFRRGQAIMLESWLRLQNRDVKIPVHARAQEMRQIADNQWDARNVRVSTSEFYEPHLSIGSERVMIIERPAPTEGGVTETFIDAESNTMLVAGVPVVPWSRFQGTVERVPLRGVEVGTERNDGFFLRTIWDLYTLMGKEAPAGIEVDLKADAYFERAAAAGIELRYDVGDAEGVLDLYGMIDGGEDRTSSGRDVDSGETFRGVALFEHQGELSRYWTLQAQVAVISDPTYITSWREDDFVERREYETSLYFKHQKDNAALTFLTKYSLQDFLSNDYLLASKQYTVDKMPELGYRRYGDSLFRDRFTYSTENRLTNMRMVFQEGTPREIGIRGRAFDINENTEIDEALEGAGLRDNWVARFDSRHELSMPMQWGAFDVTPFVVGRLTAYNDDFENYSSDADSLRMYGAAGVRISTVMQRVYNSVESQIFDVHRIRHLMEPYMTVWSAFSSVSQDDLPVYDEDVESIADGSAIEIGLRNTWQTQRGGPGNWRSVDYIAVDVAAVFTSEDEPDESPTPQFFDYRPEYSQFGNHVRASAAWLLSDSLTFVGEGVYTLHDTRFARGSIGVELRHTPQFLTYVEYRFIDVDDTRLLAVNWQYQISAKYRLEFTPQYDFRFGDLRSLNFRIRRSFPDFDVTLQVKYDQIRDDTSLGASLGFAEF